MATGDLTLAYRIGEVESLFNVQCITKPGELNQGTL